MPTKTVQSILDTNKSYQYVDNGDPMRGGMKDVYFSPDRSYVVAFYRTKPDAPSIERLRRIATQYYDSFFNNPTGNYYKQLYSWPTDVVGNDGQIGLVVPCFASSFFFKKGYALNNLLIGKEKEGKWFASAKFRSKDSKSRLDHSELGNWLSYFQICVKIARGVKRLHAAGLAHSDLSYKNVLIDPITKSASIIDIDGLVVPGLFPPDVIGTADFIAPEVLATKHLDKDHPNRKLPSRLTDLHALAVLIYMYLLYRHPLRGGNYFGPMDSEKEEDLLMGERALFIEHPTDKSNQNFTREYGDNLTKLHPWTNIAQTPYSVTGPYLKALFDQAFIRGLHSPNDRPPAVMWEEALIKTTDLKLPCCNKGCTQQWFIYNNTIDTHCPFCNTKYPQAIPVLDFYFSPKPTVFKPENQRMVVYNETTLHLWHTNRNTIRNESLTDREKIRVGYFSFHNQSWVLVNEGLPTMKDISEDRAIPIGGMVVLAHEKKILLDSTDGGRLAIVSIANNK